MKVGTIADLIAYRLERDHFVKHTSTAKLPTKHGEFQGCVPADHLDQVGQISNDRRNPKTGFNHLGWYRTIAFGLAERE